MKKIILLTLILLMTGCYENSGKLTTTCVKKDNINTMNEEITYLIDFKENIINEVKVIHYYNDSQIGTISSIKSSINSTDKFINGLKRSIEIDENNEFKVVYTIDSFDNEKIIDKFDIKKTRSDLVKDLEEKGFICN